MQLEVVKLADVKPDPNNPREDFGDIEMLAASFLRNPIHPGEPINAIVTVRDGKGQRIVDGERRYKAMLSIGTKECHAIVCDDLDDANSVLAMLDTDDKMQLTDVERSRGVQQMMALGLDDDVAESVADLPPGSAAKLKCGRKRAGKKAEQMTIRHLMAIADAEEQGDIEAAKAIAKASEELSWQTPEWESVSDKYERLRERKAGWDLLVAICEEKGIPIVDKKPKRAVSEKTLYGLKDTNRKELLKEVGSVKGDIVVVGREPTLENPYCIPEVYKLTPELTEKESEKRTSQNKLKSAMTRDKRRRAQFVGKMLVEDVGKLKSTLDLFCTDFATEEYEVSDFIKKAGIERSDLECWTSPYFMAIRWPQRDSMTQDELLTIMQKKQPYTYTKRSAERLVRLLDALKADGYEPSGTEEALYERCRKIMEEEG